MMIEKLFTIFLVVFLFFSNHCFATPISEGRLAASLLSSETDLFQKLQYMTNSERTAVINELLIKINSLEIQAVTFQKQIEQIKNTPNYKDLEGTVILSEAGRNTTGIIGLVSLFMGYINLGPGEALPKPLTITAGSLLAVAFAFHTRGADAANKIKINYSQIDRYERALKITRKEIEYEKTFILDLSQSLEIVSNN